MVSISNSASTLSLMTKLILYNNLILPVLLYEIKAWLLLSVDITALKVFQSKVLSKNFSPVLVGNDFRI